MNREVRRERCKEIKKQKGESTAGGHSRAPRQEKKTEVIGQMRSAPGQDGRGNPGGKHDIRVNGGEKGAGPWSSEQEGAGTARKNVSHSRKVARGKRTSKRRTLEITFNKVQISPSDSRMGISPAG